ncbi:MAG: hypothetical protein OJF52_001774 [Nitrospira sp.]|nr:MAG: hypothetical protein OJF52_001774 [Nitrospira sp.]
MRILLHKLLGSALQLNNRRSVLTTKRDGLARSERGLSSTI